VLNHLETCATNDFTHVAVSHTRENENSTERGNKISVLGATRTHWAYLVGNCGVEDCQVPGYATLDELFEDDVSGGDAHLGAAGACVINLDGNAGPRNSLAAKLKPGQRVPGDISLNGLFDRHNFFNFVNLVDNGAAA
jgi:hypothetical protein